MSRCVKVLQRSSDKAREARGDDVCESSEVFR